MPLPLLDAEFSQPWYRQGLSFSCTGCGKCCTGTPGFVWLCKEEIEEIAHFLGLSYTKFLKKYTRTVDGRISLVEEPKSFDCVFLKDKKFCAIYPHRPLQCRTFPWWPGILASKEKWDAAASYCEGINEAAPVVPYEEVQAQRHLMEKRP